MWDHPSVKPRYAIIQTRTSHLSTISDGKVAAVSITEPRQGSTDRESSVTYVVTITLGMFKFVFSETEYLAIHGYSSSRVGRVGWEWLVVIYRVSVINIDQWLCHPRLYYVVP